MRAIHILLLILGILSLMIGFLIYLFINKEKTERKKYANYNMKVIYMKYFLEYLVLSIIFIGIGFIIF